MAKIDKTGVDTKYLKHKRLIAYLADFVPQKGTSDEPNIEALRIIGNAYVNVYEGKDNDRNPAIFLVLLAWHNSNIKDKKVVERFNDGIFNVLLAPAKKRPRDAKKVVAKMFDEVAAIATKNIHDNLTKLLKELCIEK